MRYVLRDGALIPSHLAPRPPRARSELPSPYIRPDGMADTLNPANGLLYDSRSAYERGVRDAGCHILEAGEGEQRAPSHEGPGDVERDIKTAIEQLEGQP